MRPTASKGGRAKSLQSTNAILTNTTNWQNNAISTALGCLVTRAKSFGVSSKPRPIIIIANAKGSITVIIPESMYIYSLVLFLHLLVFFKINCLYKVEV